MANPHAEPWPEEIRLSSDGRVLLVAFGAERFPLAAELLRVESPSAEVQGHSPAERKTPAGKRNVRIVSVDPVGNYAVRLGFDDGHATGIYGWSFLHRLGRDGEGLFAAYLDRLAAAGATRG